MFSEILNFRDMDPQLIWKANYLKNDYFQLSYNSSACVNVHDTGYLIATGWSMIDHSAKCLTTVVSRHFQPHIPHRPFCGTAGRDRVAGKAVLQ